MPTLTGMNRRPRIAVIAFGQAPSGLIYELEKRGVDATKGEIADVEELVESQDPHLIALSGIRGAMELSTLLEDQDRTASPRVAVIAARRDLSRLWGLNRDVVISLLATEMGDKVVAGRLDALARQAAKKRGEALEPAAGANVSLEPRPGIDAQTTMAPQAVAAIQLVKQAQKADRPGTEPGLPSGKRPTDDVAELDSELLESDRPPNPEAPLPSVLMTKLGLGLPEDLRSLVAQKDKAFPSPPEAQLTKSSAPTDPPPESLGARDSAWDMEVTAQYESVTARPPEEKTADESGPSKDDQPIGPGDKKSLPDAGSASSNPLPSEPFIAHKSSPHASDPFVAEKSSPAAGSAGIASEAEDPDLAPEVGLERLLMTESEASAAPSSQDEAPSGEATVTLTDSLSPGDLASEPPLPNERSESNESASSLAELLPERKVSGLSPRPSVAPPGKKMSPVAGIILVLMGGVGAAYLISSASQQSAPRATGDDTAPPSEPLAPPKSSSPALEAHSPPSEPAPRVTPPADPEEKAVPQEPTPGPSEAESPPVVTAPAPTTTAPSTSNRDASASELSRALTVRAVRAQTCADLIPNPPVIGPDPAAQASPPWNAARKAIVKGDLVAAKTGMCEAALINPKSPALEALALLFVTEGAPAKALIWLEKAEAVRPGVRETLDLRAIALTQLGRLEEARQVWFRALNLTAEDASRRQGNAIEDINVGKQYLKRGDIPRAERLLRRAVVLAPENSVGLATLAEVLARKKAYDEAAILAEAAIARESYLPDAYVTLAEIAREQGDLAKARKDLERALKIRPDLWAAKKLLQDLEKTGK